MLTFIADTTQNFYRKYSRENFYNKTYKSPMHKQEYAHNFYSLFFRRPYFFRMQAKSS